MKRTLLVLMLITRSASADLAFPRTGGAAPSTPVSGGLTTTDGGVANSLVQYSSAAVLAPMSITYPSALVASTGICGASNCLNWVVTPGVIFFSATSALNVVGIVAPTAGTTRVDLWNTGSNAVTFTHQDANETTAANRLINGTGDSSTNVVVAAGQFISYVYDYTAARWREMATTSGSGYFLSSGGTMTGTLTINAATGISTVSGHNLVIAPAGTDVVDFRSAIINTTESTGLLDVRAGFTNNGAGNCNGLGSSNAKNCLAQNTYLTNPTGATWMSIYAQQNNSAATAFLQIVNSSTASTSTVNFYDSTHANIGEVGVGGSANADADVVSSLFLFTITGALRLLKYADDGATTIAWEVRDNVGAGNSAGTTLLAEYGSGLLVLPSIQTLTIADNGGGTAATGNLDIQSSSVNVVCNDTTAVVGCAVTVQETSAQSGASADVCVITEAGGKVTFADVTNVFSCDGFSGSNTTVTTTGLSVNDCIHIVYRNGLWICPGF